MKKILIIGLLAVSCKQMNTCQCVSTDGQDFTNEPYFETAQTAEDLCDQKQTDEGWNECYLLD